MTDCFSEFGPHEESLFGKIPIWDAITIGKTFARLMGGLFTPIHNGSIDGWSDTDGEFIEGTSVA